MSSLPLRGALLLCLLGAGACKDQATARAEAQVARYELKLEEGQAFLSRGDFESAVKAFRAAASESPRDPIPLMWLADTYRQSGNEPAAELSWRSAEELVAIVDDEVRARMARMYRDSGNAEMAIKTWSSLLDAGKLQRDDILDLARLQAKQGDAQGAFATLMTIQMKDPDDVEAKVIEAEALLASGEELKATNIMDRLAASHPTLASNRLLRARYFFINGFPDMASQELATLRGSDAELTEVVALQARIHLAQRKFDEAQAALEALLKKRPSEVEFLAQLAEVKLANGRLDQAEDLVAQALRQKPSHPRALFVRSRILEDKGELGEAVKGYQQVIRLSPTFSSALSRLWRIHDVRKEYDAAIRVLEKLVKANEAEPSERVKLAELYARTRRNASRGISLIDEALKRDPQNARYKEIRSQLQRALPRKKAPMVIQMK